MANIFFQYTKSAFNIFSDRFNPFRESNLFIRHGILDWRNSAGPIQISIVSNKPGTLVSNYNNYIILAKFMQGELIIRKKLPSNTPLSNSQSKTRVLSLNIPG